MGSTLVLPLTKKLRALFWLLRQADGAVGPGGSYGGSHLEVAIWVVLIYKRTFHPPLHGGCGDPMEGAAALQSPLRGARGIE